MEKFTSKIDEMTLKEKIKMIHAAGLFCTGGVERLGIPELRMSDGPSGVRQEFENDKWIPSDISGDFVSWLPSNTCLASTWNPELALSFGQILGSEARGRGKDIILAPGINIKRTPLCGRNFEYFSEDPVLTGRLAVPLIQGIQENDVAACVKHFALNNQELDRMTVEAEIDDATLHELYLSAFLDALTEGKSLTVMGAYNRYDGSFCCESRKLLQDILRNQWHYDGVAISDWGGVHHTEEAALHGVDIEMSVTPDFDDYKMADPLHEKVKNGEIPESVIDEKVIRILTLMDKIHMNHPERQTGSFNTHEHQQMTLQIAEEGIVLLKNEKKRLPLTPELNANKQKKILIAGDNAVRLHSNGGGSAEIKALYEISPLLGVRMILGGNTECTWMPGYYVDNESEIRGEQLAGNLDPEHNESNDKKRWEEEILPKRRQYLEKLLEAVPDYDEVIFIGGLNHSLDIEGFDRPDMKLPYGQDEVISALADATDNLTVVLINGSPVEMPWIDKVHSLIQTSYYGMNGGYALAKVLFGKVNPSGKLPETYPIRLADTPTEVYHSYPGEMKEGGHRHVTYSEKLMVGYRYYTSKEVPVLFPFGHGLSYTTFSCSNFHVAVHDISQTNESLITLSCEMQNTGGRDGKETLQLYVGIPKEGQPKMALKAFKKVSLNATEKKEVSLTLTGKAFAAYSTEKACFVVRPGTYELYAGTSAENILYHTSIDLSQEYILS